MLINGVFNVIIYFVERFILPVFPTNFVFYPISEFKDDLSAVESVLTKTFSGVSNIFPIDLVLAFVLIFFVAEIALFGIKGIFWLINVFRGSGA